MFDQPDPLSIIITESELGMMEAALRHYLGGLTEGLFEYPEDVVGAYEVLYEKLDAALRKGEK